ncbi:MAG: hypothetical protein BVN32_09360 [Proteobacteria bacterium ST_bin14]|nr:MAG: hypothetical protein BVN32_09360 [Proteobacteria bacterium ST_bin14]
MNRQGSPLRFLALVVGGWVSIRVIMLWPNSAALTVPLGPLESQAPMATLPPIAPREAGGGVYRAPRTDALPLSSSSLSPKNLPAPHRQRPAPDPQRIALALLGMIRFGAAEPVPPAGRSISPGPSLALWPWPAADDRPDRSPSRWSGGFWLIARDGRGVGASLSGSQLGGSQAGARLAYALGSARRVSIVGRLASPLAGSGQEGAVGLEWRPTRLPVRLVAEQRIGINGAVGGPSLALVGGVGPVPIGRGFRLESYGQAGIIGRGGVIGYADGALRVNRHVAVIGGSPIDLGAGGWGAVQPGAARLDLGPSIGARLPVSTRRVRISLDWRQRVAGDALPGSGPALSIGADL